MIQKFTLRFLLALTLFTASLVHAQNAPFSNLRPGLASSTSTNSVTAAAVDPGSATNAVFSPATPLMVANTARALAPSSSRAVDQQSVAATAFSTATATMVANRAHTLGDKPDGSGTRYFAVTDANLKNLTPQQQLQRLSPTPVKAADGVRKLDIYVDLKDPLVLQARPGQSVDIGSADIKAQGVQNVQVNASIFLNGITVIDK